MMRGRNVLVAGGTGLVGASLTYRLHALGAHVRSTYRTRRPPLLAECYRPADFTEFEDCREATRGMDITPPRFTALVIVGANPGIGQSVLGRVLGIARSGAMLLTDWLEEDRKSTRLNSSHSAKSRMPSSA